MSWMDITIALILFGSVLIGINVVLLERRVSRLEEESLE